MESERTRSTTVRGSRTVESVVDNKISKTHAPRCQRSGDVKYDEDLNLNGSKKNQE